MGYDRIRYELVDNGVEVPESMELVSSPCLLAKPGVGGKVCEITPQGGFAYCDGWNGSFHDAIFQPFLAAWGPTTHVAKNWLEKAVEVSKNFNIVDTTTAKMRARALVRKGD